MSNRNIVVAVLFGALLVLATGFSAQAQPPPYPVWGSNPYYLPPWSGGFGPGNVLNGQANVINAQGQFMQQAEQARIQREQANQAALQTKKDQLDWKNYERANTPTFTDLQLKNQSTLLRRILKNAAEGEILSGLAQNTLLPFLEGLILQGIPGPLLPIDPGQLQQLNVVMAGGRADVSMLRDGGKLDWPFALQGQPKQERIAALLPTAVSQTIQGKLDGKTFNELQKSVRGLTDDLKQRYFKDEVDMGQYLTAKRFLDNLSPAIDGLQRAGSSKLLDGTMAARGRNVPELVMHMQQNGLRFGPSLPGGEAAYFGVYNAMRAFATGAQSGQGFSIQPAQSFFNKK
jgi:hypothetical protein